MIICFAKYDGCLSSFHVSSNIAEYDITVTCVLIMTRVQCKIYILAPKHNIIGYIKKAIGSLIFCLKIWLSNVKLLNIGEIEF